MAEKTNDYHLGMWKSYKCHKCGKEFYCEDQSAWAYKLRHKKNNHDYRYKMYCSYTCYRVDEKPIEEKWNKAHRNRRKEKKQ